MANRNSGPEEPGAAGWRRSADMARPGSSHSLSQPRRGQAVRVTQPGSGASRPSARSHRWTLLPARAGTPRARSAARAHRPTARRGRGSARYTTGPPQKPVDPPHPGSESIAPLQDAQLGDDHVDRSFQTLKAFGPDRYRVQSHRVTAGRPKTPLSLNSLQPASSGESSNPGPLRSSVYLPRGPAVSLSFKPREDSKPTSPTVAEIPLSPLAARRSHDSA
jgi:hypothetical protein